MKPGGPIPGTEQADMPKAAVPKPMQSPPPPPAGGPPVTAHGPAVSKPMPIPPMLDQGYQADDSAARQRLAQAKAAHRRAIGPVMGSPEASTVQEPLVVSPLATEAQLAWAEPANMSFMGRQVYDAQMASFAAMRRRSPEEERQFQAQQTASGATAQQQRQQASGSTMNWDWLGTDSTQPK